DAVVDVGVRDDHGAQLLVPDMQLEVRQHARAQVQDRVEAVLLQQVPAGREARVGPGRRGAEDRQLHGAAPAVAWNPPGTATRTSGMEGPRKTSAIRRNRTGSPVHTNSWEGLAPSVPRRPSRSSVPKT